MEVFHAIRKLLDDQSISYKHINHEPTPTSADSARVRGEEMNIGGKALVLKVGKEFGLFVLSAALKVDTDAIRTHFQEKKVRFATPEELKELTGLVPGSVPPFGKPVLPLDLYLDKSILQNEKIAFNAGSITDSIIMSVEDYVRVANPQILEFSKR